MIGVCNSQPYGEAKLCYVLKFVGGSVGRGGFSDPCRVVVMLIIASTYYEHSCPVFLPPVT